MSKCCISAPDRRVGEQRTRTFTTTRTLHPRSRSGRFRPSQIKADLHRRSFLPHFGSSCCGRRSIRRRALHAVTGPLLAGQRAVQSAHLKTLREPSAKNGPSLKQQRPAGIIAERNRLFDHGRCAGCSSDVVHTRHFSDRACPPTVGEVG